ncbi:chemotaxis protein [Shewanella sp. NIFS-20-20]|uniref:chemotaxis protein n=1 Tax=Shewanella sp. NIFS-20-20 TaxID=2853806 RepID=UPI001C45F7D3|nr:chemotaxis protein [Shewanella sp. NIFS-20-20]MBV7314975.1 chemotaxis protein [Shewanella sp. NIFS-20-20]
MNLKANESQGLLLFRLNQQQSFALGTLKVRELVPFSSFNTIPHAHACILGTATIRGVTIPIIDMAKAVGYRPLHPDEYSTCYIIITDCQRSLTGFMVRHIERIIECDWKKILPPPTSLRSNAYLTGVTYYQEQLVQLLDIERVLNQIFPPKIGRVSVNELQREQLKGINILLVDDSMVARKQLADALDDLHIPYEVTANGQQALTMMKAAAAHQQAFDVLVSDIEMPGLDGYELAFAVRDNAHLKHTYIILHTSLSSEICVTQAHQVGANEALTKFDATELVAAMLRGASQKGA